MQMDNRAKLLLRTIGAFVQRRGEQLLAALKKEIAQLQREISFLRLENENLLQQNKGMRKLLEGWRYREVWTASETYYHNNLVTHAGCLFICIATVTRTRPATPDSDWVLCVKRGRDGRNACDYPHDADARDAA